MAHEKDELSVEEIGVEIIHEMDREFHSSPDRVIAVVGAAYIDDLLARLLRSALLKLPKDVESLLRPDAPLGSFGNRVELACCLGLITLEQRDDLKKIGKIRNAFAHRFKAPSFDEAPVRDYCSSLKQPGIVAAMPEKLFPPETAATLADYIRETSETPRERFRTSIFALFGSLLRRLAYVRRATQAGWFTYDPDALNGPSSPGSGEGIDAKT